MKIEFANNLMNRPLDHRFCKTISHKGKKVDCLMLSHDGIKATLKRLDGKNDIIVLLSDVDYR